MVTFGSRQKADAPCDSYSGNLCTGFGNNDTKCWTCGWDRFQHPRRKRSQPKPTEPTITGDSTLAEAVEVLAKRSRIGGDASNSRWINARADVAALLGAGFKIVRTEGQATPDAERD